MHDSVFWPSIQFASPLAEVPKLGRKRVEKAMDKIENKYAAALRSIVFQEADAFVKRLVEVKEIAKIQEARWGVQSKVQQALYALWREGWALGEQHGIEEMGLGQKPARFARFAESEDERRARELAQLRRGARIASNVTGTARELRSLGRGGGGQSAVSQPQPNVEAVDLRNSPAEQAIQQRTLQLASDVSGQTLAEIKQSLIAAVQPDTQGRTLSRSELYKQIDQSLGRGGARREIEFPNGKDSSGKRRGVWARSELIARTELTAVYSLGRVDSYLRSGLVSEVRWVSIEDLRVCPVCRSRNGMVLSLEQVAQSNPIPAHPACRCVLSPIMVTDPADEERRRDPKRRAENRQLTPLKPTWLASSALSLGVLYLLLLRGRGGVGLAGARVPTPRAPSPVGVALAVLPEAAVIGSVISGAEVGVVTVPGASTSAVVVNGVNLNTASIAQLRSLGLTTAQAVALRSRVRNLPLASLEDVMQVRGISGRTLRKLERLQLGAPRAVNLNLEQTVEGIAQGLGVNRTLAQKILEERTSGGAYTNVEELIERVRRRGGRIGPAAEQILRNPAQAQVFPVTDATARRVIQPLGVAGSLSAPVAGTGPAVTPAQASMNAQVSNLLRTLESEYQVLEAQVQAAALSLESFEPVLVSVERGTVSLARAERLVDSLSRLGATANPSVLAGRAQAFRLRINQAQSLLVQSPIVGSRAEALGQLQGLGGRTDGLSAQLASQQAQNVTRFGNYRSRLGAVLEAQRQRSLETLQGLQAESGAVSERRIAGARAEVERWQSLIQSATQAGFIRGTSEAQFRKSGTMLDSRIPGGPMIRFINDIVAYPNSSAEFRKLGAKDKQKRKKRNLVAAGLIGGGSGALLGYGGTGIVAGAKTISDLSSTLEKKNRAERYAANPKMKERVQRLISKKVTGRLLPIVLGGTAIGAGIGGTLRVRSAMKDNQGMRR